MSGAALSFFYASGMTFLLSGLFNQCGCALRQANCTFLKSVDGSTIWHLALLCHVQIFCLFLTACAAAGCAGLYSQDNCSKIEASPHLSICSSSEASEEVFWQILLPQICSQSVLAQ